MTNKYKLEISSIACIGTGKRGGRWGMCVRQGSSVRPALSRAHLRPSPHLHTHERERTHVLRGTRGEPCHLRHNAAHARALRPRTHRHHRPDRPCGIAGANDPPVDGTRTQINQKCGTKGLRAHLSGTRMPQRIEAQTLPIDCIRSRRRTCFGPFFGTFKSKRSAIAL